jgi:hypothetical protein
MSQICGLVPKWHYKSLQEGDTVRDPIQGEFFATEAIENSADALVREGIQNSLDARRRSSATPWGKEILRVRIGISGSDQAIPAALTAPFLAGNWEHLNVPGNGLSIPPGPDQPCTFLTFEDFGTTGLDGDPAQWKKVPGIENRFFNFFRAEGHSDKSETDRGRWGVGKTVFLRASRISTFWAFTRRELDGARLLMGRTVLKSHDLTNGTTYVPDGYFGIKAKNSSIVLPVDDDETIFQFCKCFGLKRRDESGLSIVVPFYDEDEITVDTILHAVVIGYFYPILSGELIVEIVGPDNTVVTLDQSNLANTANRFDRSRPLMSVIQLSDWARSLEDTERILLNKPRANRAPKWTPELFPEKEIENLRNRFKSGERIAIRVPFQVREKKKEPQWSWFDVFIAADGSEKRGRPIYVRDGITISDVRGRTTHGVASLVLITDRPLATLLGDSENPAHTQWQKECSHYRHKYETGVANIEFVANSVAEILRLIAESDVDEDPTVLIDLFSLPIPKQDDSLKTRKKKPKKEDHPDSTPDEPVEPPPPKPQGFRITKSEGGFSVSSGDPDASIPKQILIEVAYDDRSRNPLKSWYQTDFDVVNLNRTYKNIKEVSAKGNRLVVDVLEPEFKLTVTGFDERRNLFVRVQGRETTDGN